MINYYLKVITYYPNASFAVHPDFNIHTGVIVTMGQREMQPMSTKRKLNTMISTEDELVDVDDASV